MPIRRGDGTPVSPLGIAEVRLGDGTVLYPTAGGGDSGGEIEHFTWDQTHTDTGWLFNADANDDLTVEKVTNLDSGGSGSFAAALSAAEDNDNTLIVFEVGGVIDNGGNTYIRSRGDNVYIAGQTAPYPGITVIRGGIRIHGHNTIMSHIGFLPGDDVDEPSKCRAVTYNQDADNILCDHCSVGWAPDTNVNIRDDSNGNSLINSINAEALNDSSHPEAPHGYGLLIRSGSVGVSVLGNLIAHNWKRNLKPNDDCGIVYANNYIYNWGDRVQHGSDGTSEVDWIGNIVEEGADTDLSSGVFDGDDATVYWGNNELIPSDTPLNDGDIDYVDDPMHLPSGLDESDLVTPSDLKEFLSPMVGMRPADRDPWSQRVIDEWLDGSGEIIDHQDDVGGYPDYDPQTRSLDPPSSGLLDWLQQHTDEVEGTG